MKRNLIVVFARIFTGLSGVSLLNGFLLQSIWPQGRSGVEWMTIAAVLFGLAIVLWIPVLADSVMSRKRVIVSAIMQVFSEIGQDIGDDSYSLEIGSPTKVFVLVPVMIAILIGFANLLGYYGKFTSTWSDFPVWTMVACMVALMTVAMTRNDWYHDRSNRTPSIVFILVVVSLFACLWGGIYFNEPVETGGESLAQIAARQAQFDVDNKSDVQVADPCLQKESCAPDKTLAFMSVFLWACCTFALWACLFIWTPAGITIFGILWAAFWFMCSITIVHFWFVSVSALCVVLFWLIIHEVRVRTDY